MTRSAVESKNAPRIDADCEAFATAPSKRSGSADAVSRKNPSNVCPLPMATAVATPMTSPRPVSWSGVTPRLARKFPMGLTPLSVTVRR